MKKNYLIYLLTTLCFFCACDNFDYKPDHTKVAEESEDGSGDSEDPPLTDPTIYTLDLQDEQQEIDNFGASDAWSMKFVGRYWPVDKRNQIADLLFSKEFDENGNPKGIGLSLWRMNFGAGSSQRPYPNIGNMWMNMPCIRTADGEYHMTLADEAGGQFWMLKAAKERGCEEFLGFANSPPYYWTYTGYTTSKENSNYERVCNLKSENQDNYATYLAELVKRIKQTHDVDINYVCPVNEPEWQADGVEGCHATNSDIATIAKVVSSKFAAENLDTKVVVSESGKHQFIYQIDWDQPSPLLHGSKALSFFGTSGSNLLKSQSNVAQLLASHSYWTVNTETQLKQIRQKVGEAIKRYNIKFWQTEFCILSDDYDLGTRPDGGPVGGSGRDMTMKLALYVARIIHSDLVFANASAWHWWLAATPFDYKDGLLYLSENPNDGEVSVPKLLWAFGNYSRFIRPKAHRIGISSTVDVSNLKGVMASAYKNENGKLVVVMINTSTKAECIALNTSDGSSKSYIPYITSDEVVDNLRPMSEISASDPFILPAKSIVTFCEK